MVDVIYRTTWIAESGETGLRFGDSDLLRSQEPEISLQLRVPGSLRSCPVGVRTGWDRGWSVCQDPASEDRLVPDPPVLEVTTARGRESFREELICSDVSLVSDFLGYRGTRPLSGSAL